MTVSRTTARHGHASFAAAGPRATHRSPLAVLAIVATISGGLGACSDGGLPKLADLNPWATKDVPLPGKRVAVLTGEDKLGADLASADAPISLPAERTNEAWSQPGGTANNSPGHLALPATLKVGWTASAGSGSSSSGKLTASPIVYGGNVYTLDTVGSVTAFSAAGGATQWHARLVPDTAKSGGKADLLSFTSLTTLVGGNSGESKGYGGGLAADNGRVFAATGFGTVVALDAKTGKKLWEKMLGTPIRSSPTAADDKVFVITSEGRFFCLSASDGAELWAYRGINDRAGLLTNASPAIDGDIVIAPYPSGDVIALRVSDGQPAWTETLTRARSNSAMSTISDAARPVIEGGIVFAVGHGGRMVATQQRSGERVWSASVASTQAPVVAGDNVFVVDIGGIVSALSRKDGKVRWTAKLPAAKTWSGPVLAGNRLWLASTKGLLVGVEATTGRVITQAEIGSAVYIAPIVAQGRLYVLTDGAKLVTYN